MPNFKMKTLIFQNITFISVICYRKAEDLIDYGMIRDSVSEVLN